MTGSIEASSTAPAMVARGQCAAKTDTRIPLLRSCAVTIFTDDTLHSRKNISLSGLSCLRVSLGMSDTDCLRRHPSDRLDSYHVSPRSNDICITLALFPFHRTTRLLRYPPSSSHSTTSRGQIAAKSVVHTILGPIRMPIYDVWAPARKPRYMYLRACHFSCSIETCQIHIPFPDSHFCTRKQKSYMVSLTRGRDSTSIRIQWYLAT